MQIHLALAYLASAIQKSTSEQWWNGELLWRVLMLPEYKQVDMAWMANWPFVAMAAGWGALAIEMLFILLIWHERLGPVWLVLTVSLHLGIAIFLGLHMFGAIMCTLLIALFGVSAEPRGGCVTLGAAWR